MHLPLWVGLTSSILWTLDKVAPNVGRFGFWAIPIPTQLQFYDEPIYPKQDQLQPGLTEPDWNRMQDGPTIPDTNRISA